MMEKEKTELERVKRELQDCYTAMHTAISAANIYYFEYFPKENYALQYHGKEVFALEERLEEYPESWFRKKVTHPQDEYRLRNAFWKMKQGEKSSSCKVRNLVNGQYCWFRYQFTSLYDEEGRQQKVVCTAQDISESKKVEELNEDLRNLYNRVPGWIFICKNDENWTVCSSNPGIYEATGYTLDAFQKEKNRELASVVPAAYQQKIRKEICRMEQEGFGARASVEVPICHKNGMYTWLNCSIYWDKKESDEGLLYCICSDISKLKKSQEELHESNAMYELTTKHANMNLWMYDIQKDVMYNTISSKKFHLGEDVIPDFLHSEFIKKTIREDSIEDFYGIYQSLKKGEESVTKDIWMHKKDQSGWWCERITYVTVFDEEHHPYKAFGLGRDVTDFKEAERRIEAEKEFQESADDEKILLKTRCNLMTDEVETLMAKPEMQAKKQAKTFTGGVRQVADNAYDDADRETVFRMLSVKYLERAAKENRRYKFEYRRRDAKGHPSWSSVTVNVFSHPDTQNVIVFVNIYDINTERKLSSIVNRIALVDYEVLALIYVKTDEMESIRCKDLEETRRLENFTSYRKGMENYMSRYIVEEQKEEALFAFSLPQIQKGLCKNSVYEVSFSVKGEKNLQKSWQFTYFDETRETIIYTRTDITKIFREQEMQRETLKNALLQAEEANKAKTNFLSRMSHEIRTPMNAIIGMNALAVQSIDQPDQVRDYLSKVGISARFLLSLINDILDMSRIESGKVVLKNEKFPLEEFVHNVNDIIYSQAAQRGIDYDCVISSYTADYYIGDSMKLQQILVNLLGNAVKFTAAGGKVQLIIRQERMEQNKAFMVFSVNDTGIGISKELKEKMFEPFEQGDSTATTPYKGTGLGLAIAKNLVAMMGGTITVNSIEGVGSEFTVRVPLICCEEERYSFLKQELPFQHLKTLIVDDDVTICEQTSKLLVEIGMKAEWVESGIRAVELIRAKWERKEFFNIVLLDWKMPEMDGIETARQIRAIVGDEVTIIVMTAYDWNEIEQEAKQAGVNLLVTKPLFKSSLISVFETALHEKKQEKAKVQAENFDFSGKKVLLVEDHILNVEVARRLLESKHAVVEVAENGLRSIEMFMEAPENYYDIILMDIRMPVMDGLTATKSLRQLRRACAKTVPIIAMSANAFDEDVEKSKAAGMNEHLSKPIEPQVLFAVLHKWLQSDTMNYKE